MSTYQFARVGVSVLMFSLFAGCASEQAKEAPPAPKAASVTAPTTPPPPRKVAQPVAPKPAAVNPLNDPNNILSKRSVYYDYDKYDVKPEFRPLLEAHATYLKQHLGANMAIEGNCDERGSREYNIALGQRRSDGVKKMLLLLGAQENQIESVSFGKEKPKAPGHDEQSWAQNRRSDLNYKRAQ